MNRSRRLQPVRQVADDKAEAAARALAAMQQRLAEQKARLSQLQEFRAQYQEQRARSGEAGMDGFRLRDYNVFVARIDKALEQQQRTIEQLKSAAEQKRQQWIDLLGKARALGKVVERYAEAEQQATERREQQQSDALAQVRRIRLEEE